MAQEELDPRVLAELLGLIAHDLRNPLSALQSNVSYLATVLDHADDDSQEALADVAVSCDGLLHIIQNLDLLAYVLKGRAPIASGPLALKPVVTDVVARAAGIAKSHQVEVITEPSVYALDVRVVAHREMLTHALDNLLHNAIQHGGTTPVHVSAREADGRAYVLILDRGTPLAEGLRESSFSAEGQLSSKGSGGGRYSRGIGLFSAKVAAEAAGGTIGWVQSGADMHGFELSLEVV